LRDFKNMNPDKFDPEDFLNLARALLNEDNTDFENARYRSSISRAYYAAFLKAMEKCAERRGYTYDKSADVHKEVIKDVKSILGDRTSGDFLRSLKKLRTNAELKELRTNADYDLSPSPNKTKVEEAINLSDLVIGSVGSI